VKLPLAPSALSKDLREAIEHAMQIRAAYLDVRAQFDFAADAEREAIQRGEDRELTFVDLVRRRHDAATALQRVTRDYCNAMQVAIDTFARDFLPIPEWLHK
jgi:hypothetical protein